ncbi:hypothetical protein K431DRAFT_218256 [Polychaeton citri CBS 116435]|uniref:Uncharacterized protein n=1 Tax=Polychaeton citri CBS 116435 TaxID=1314669 RepID=A0A9P4QG37_9PEZI|nr:hypothetical protein K431DRAFT_218256 [Polychaeton citri CBS 116435]
MIALMGELTDKPDWIRKLGDKSIIAKWRKEAMEMGLKRKGGFSEAMFDYCTRELKDYARYSGEFKFVPAITASAIVFKSDELLSESARQELIAAVAPLEDVPAPRKDWHPGSDEQVLDLVHPSLFPLQYGRSRILADGLVPLNDCVSYTGKGVIMPVPKDEDLLAAKEGALISTPWGEDIGTQHGLYSRNFQWLPCDVSFQDNDSVRIKSYINNLHPQKHQDLYRVLETIIASAVPMWNATIASTERDRPSNRIDTYNYEFESQRPEGWGEDEWLRSIGEYAREELDYTWAEENDIPFLPPEPRKYSARIGQNTDHSHPHMPLDLREHFREDGLQIIVKLANIHLTSEKPEYSGGSWHIEGQLNEHIVATALYYYDSDNVTDSHLAFRELTDFVGLEYQQSRFRHIEEFYDIEEDGPKIQELGSVLTRQGRLLTFPNVLQHRVQPFKLADASRPGHRKIVALFLVDPHVRIPSTKNVPPQQKEWWREMVLGLERVAALPAELGEWTVNSAGDMPIDLEEAKELRANLMEERKAFVQEVKGRYDNSGGFSFCEH